MVNSAAVVIRIGTALLLSVLFGLHFADFSLQCDEGGFGEQICNGTWFNNQFRFDYDKAFGRSWFQDSVGITVFVVNLLLILVALVLVLNAFLERITGRTMCVLKSTYSILLFLFAIFVVICRGYVNSPIAFATAGAFMVDAIVFED